MPFTRRNLKEDLDDLGSKFPTARRTWSSAWRPMRSSSRDPACVHQRVPPGYRFPYGHTHEKQEEVYVVVRGRADGSTTRSWSSREGCGARPPRYVARLRGRAGGPEIIVIGAPSLGEARREDVEGQRDWWGD